jgi:hypothetical protein
MPWWNVSATVPVIGLGNSTAIDFPLYLHEVSAGVLGNPPSQVIILGLWFCWAALALTALAGLLAIVGSVRADKGRRILLISGVIAVISVIVFAVGLQDDLSRTGSGLDLFKTASGSWGTITAYLSFGFWGALVSAATMLAAGMRRGAITTAAPPTFQPRQPEGASPSIPAADQILTAARAGRPRGLSLLIGYCSLLGICAIAIIPFVSSLAESIRQLLLSALGIQLPDQMYLWGLLAFSAVVDFVIAFGLLKRKKRVRAVVRILSALTVVGALIVIGLIAVLIVSPDLLGVGTPSPLTDSNVTMLYGGLAILALLDVVLPIAVFRYLSRANVKEYFGIVE